MVDVADVANELISDQLRLVKRTLQITKERASDELKAKEIELTEATNRANALQLAIDYLMEGEAGIDWLTDWVVGDEHAVMELHMFEKDRTIGELHGKIHSLSKRLAQLEEKTHPEESMGR